MSRTFQFLLVLVLLAGLVRADDAYKNVTDGPHSCGGVDIPYPFGIMDDNGIGDFREGFEVECNGGKPVLPTTGNGEPIRMGDFSIKTAEARVWLPVGWQCYNSSRHVVGSGSMTLQMYNESVYRISNTRNDLFVLGCFTLGYLRSKPAEESYTGELNGTTYAQLTGCLSYCNDSQSAVSGVCSGVGCCHVGIPPDLVDNSVDFTNYEDTDRLSFSSCDYAFLAEKGNYTFHTADLKRDLSRTPWSLPVRLDWAIRDNLTCKEAKKKKKDYACKSSNSLCLNATNGPGYICECHMGYRGNPYTHNGCTDIDECGPDEHYPCHGVCTNRPGSYDCTCPKHSHSANPFTQPCSPSFPLKAKIITGALGSLLIVAIIVFFLLLSKEKRKMRDYFEKNGGPTLEKLDNIKLYKKDDIKKIRKSSNIIGKGSFGKVYKGHIGDNNQLVAVKEPIVVNPAYNGQFENEIIIQSRVIHKNIVKLIGCCLEVDVPILVYEFIPKGSLADILHGQSSMALTMGQRLQIAAESAEGLAYMHSKTTTTILHGDVKPANILINDEYMPKISDFGISRLIATEKKHTGYVIGDRSYMDPVYLQTGLLTKKSDVYSFGVVLLELITRKKASYSNQNELLRNFKEAYKKDKSVIELVDRELVEVDPQLLDSLTSMISECLDLDDNQRPDMTDLEERLRDMVKRFHPTE